MNRAALIGLLGLALIAPPASADNINDGTTVFYSMGGSALLGLVCGAIVALTSDDEDPDDPYSRRGWIVGVGGVYGIEDFDDPVGSSERDALEPPSTSYSTDDGFALSGGGGYRCHKYVSTEVGFEWFGGDGYDGKLKQSGLGKVADVRINPTVITVDTRAYFPIGRYQPYALLGTGVMLGEIKILNDIDFATGEPTDLSSSDDASFTLRFGGGIDLYATENILVRGEASYVLPTGSLHDLKYLSIGMGVHWRF